MSNSVTSKEYWDRYWGAGAPRYANYDKSRGTFYSYSLLLDDCVRKARERFGSRPLKLVDCGCGEGLILRFVHEQQPGIEVWGIEYSESIEKARQMGTELGYDFHLIRDDLFEICRDRTAGPFEMLVSLGLIEHFDDPAGVVSQLSQIVAPGGCVITIIPNFDGWFNFLWKLYDPENYRHHVPISNARLLQIHRDLGLEDVTFYTMGIPSIPGINDAKRPWEKALNWVLVQLNGRILQRLWPRQASLTQRHSMTPGVACVGWRPLTAA